MRRCPECSGELVHIARREYVCGNCAKVYFFSSNYRKYDTVPLGITNQDRRKLIYARSLGRCGICKFTLRLTEMTVDHIIPRSQGGGSHISNYQASHHYCNAKKADRLPDQYTIIR